MKTMLPLDESVNLHIVSEVKIVYHNPIKPKLRPRIALSQDAEQVFRSTWDDSIEHCESFKVMLLNQNSRVLGISNISTGGIDSTTVDVRKIMQCALLANATGIIVCHNHPSGSTKPSESDVILTKRIKDASDILSLRLLDHIVLTPSEDYLSFADEGLL